jgi:hypothetical protein
MPSFDLRHAGELISRRMWLLMLLDGAERAGLAPMPGHEIHRMAFLANCLSPIYDIPIIEDEILKYRRGPFYPELQWDLDRLAVCGLAEIGDIRHERDEHGWWFFADYALAAAGIRGIEHALGSPRAKRLHSFLIEIAAAYATLDTDTREVAALEDANYSNPRLVGRALVEYGELRRNFSVRAANAFDQHVPDGTLLQRRDKLYLYFRYLDRMVDRVAV